jgi:hypothetical protein
MRLLSARLPALLLAVSALPLGCDTSTTALSHDGSVPSIDGPLGAGGGTGGAVGSGGMGTGGSIAGAGGSSPATGTGGNNTGTGGSDVVHDAGVDINTVTEAGSDSGGTAGSPDGASVDDGGPDAPAARTCPNAAPRDGDGCASAQSCFYEDCAGAGRTVATCVQGAWSVTNGPCNTFACQSGITATSCEAGKVCVAIASGFPVTLCVTNSCGTGPVSCDCVDSCIGTCSVRGTAADGIAIDCNPCSPDGCV